jgi:hypothetical protein
MVVEEGKVREFARAVKAEANGQIRDVSPVAHPTFLATSVFWDTRPSENWDDLDLPEGYEPGHALHGEQEYVFHGPPPRAGDVLMASTKSKRVFRKEGRRGGGLIFVEVVTQYKNPDGRPVADEISTAVIVSHAPEPGP